MFTEYVKSFLCESSGNSSWLKLGDFLPRRVEQTCFSSVILDSLLEEFIPDAEHAHYQRMTNVRA